MSDTISTPDAPGRQAARPHLLPLWSWNRRVGWVTTCLGAATGLVMGLWSFDGPVSVPQWLGEYGETSRRLARLGHIAFFGLGILDLLVAQELRLSSLGSRAKQTASLAMIFGNIFLPLTLFGAAAFHPIKYLMSVPAVSVFLALAITAYGLFLGKTPPEGSSPGHENTA